MPRKTTAGKRAPKNHAQLRIIGGKWRSRRICFADAEGLRPTGDRIRETLFNWLGADIADSYCLDAFAGSGALGFEALSRGAKGVVFIENNRQTFTRLLQTRAELAADNATVICNNALEWLAANREQKFNIIFLDPPFAHNLHQEALAAIVAADILAANGLLYMESPAAEVIAIPGDWRIYKEKTTGNIRYRLLQRN